LAGFEGKFLKKIKFFHKKFEMVCREGFGNNLAGLFEKNIFFLLDNRQAQNYYLGLRILA